MPLVKNWSLLLLLALAGVSPGLSWAQPADAPFDIVKAKLPDEYRHVFAYLGYKFDDKAHHIINPDGTLLGEQKFKDLTSPVDFHKDALSDEDKNGIVLGGCRLEEDTGHILCIDDKTKAKVPMPKISLEVLHKQNSLYSGQSIIARMSLLLSKEDPAKPVPAEVASQLKAMLEKSPGAAVPESLVKALTAPGAKSGDARALVESAYADSTRFFDAQQSLQDHAKSALPVFPGWNEPKRPQQFFDDNEKKLGLALRDSAQKYYAQSPIGQELLDHYKDKDGKVTLPPFLILKLDPREGAVYNYTNKTVVVNQQYVVDGITAHMPAGKDRDALRDQLKDSQKFAAYMLAHPEAQEAFFKQHDVDLYHELTHGWQDRRDSVFSEMERGNSPGVIHIEYEQEAFLQENRYMHWKVMHDPAAAMNDPNLARYTQFITNFDKFRDGVAQQYLELFPKDAATLSTVEALQKERVSIARRLMGENLHSAAIELLKMVGMARGEAELERVQSDQQKRTAAFVKNEYPKDQQEGYRGMAELYMLKAQSDKTPIERDNDWNSAEQWADALSDKTLLEQVKKAKEKKK